ncbi:MAG: PASTA domain-containing protein [Anaerolineae bacterium]
MLKKSILLLVLVFFPQWVWGQEAVTTVPDLTGLSVPAAAALLNQHDLLLGVQQNIPWTAESGLPENSISAQSAAPGESVARGTAVDVTVLRSDNMTLIYDDNDITLINRSGGTLDLNGVVFSTLESSTAASFNAARWGSLLSAEGCGQLWSVGRTSPKDIEGCTSMNWLTTNNTGEHFWTVLNGVVSFSVTQNGVARAQCPAAQAGTEPITCDFFLDAASVGETIPYIYMAYTPTQFIVLNNSTDKWLPLLNITLANASGFSSPLGLATGWTVASEFARPDLLAPGQCLLVVGAGVPLEPPQPCTPILTYAYPTAGNYFWAQDFTVDGVTDDQTHTCAAAVEGRLTLCLMPR